MPDETERETREPLTAKKVEAAKPRERDYKLADSGGLYLFVSTSGHRTWRLKYRFGGKERRLLVGTYPEVGLKRARELRDDAKQALRNGSGSQPGEDARAIPARWVTRTPSNSSHASGTRVRWHVGNPSTPMT